MAPRRQAGCCGTNEFGWLPDEQYQLANDRINEVEKMPRTLRERLTAKSE